MSNLEVGIHRTLQDFDFDVKGLADKLEEAYLAKNKDQEQWNRVTYPPSGIGYEPAGGLCARRWFYEFRGNFVRNDTKTALEFASMDMGNEGHDRIQGLFEKAGILIEAETELELDSPPIRGRIDLMVEWGGVTVVEVKTTRQEAFTILKAEGKPRIYQLFQLLIYLKAKNITRGMMLYENKNTGELLIFPIHMDEEMDAAMDRAFDWMQRVFQNEELPLRPYKNKSEGVGCKYCPFRNDCWNDEPGTVDIPLLELPKPPEKSGEKD